MKNKNIIKYIFIRLTPVDVVLTHQTEKKNFSYIFIANQEKFIYVLKFTAIILNNTFAKTKFNNSQNSQSIYI